MEIKYRCMWGQCRAEFTVTRETIYKSAFIQCPYCRSALSLESRLPEPSAQDVVEAQNIIKPSLEARVQHLEKQVRMLMGAIRGRTDTGQMEEMLDSGLHWSDRGGE